MTISLESLTVRAITVYIRAASGAANADAGKLCGIAALRKSVVAGKAVRGCRGRVKRCPEMAQRIAIKCEGTTEQDPWSVAASHG